MNKKQARRSEPTENQNHTKQKKRESEDPRSNTHRYPSLKQNLDRILHHRHPLHQLPHQPLIIIHHPLRPIQKPYHILHPSSITSLHSLFLLELFPIRLQTLNHFLFIIDSLTLFSLFYKLCLNLYNLLFLSTEKKINTPLYLLVVNFSRKLIIRVIELTGGLSYAN